eukprot:5449968-Pyramimonas_sp.AAC.1
MGRALRMMGQFRKKLTAPMIDTLVKETLPDGVALKHTLVDAVGADTMAVEGGAAKPKEVCIDPLTNSLFGLQFKQRTELRRIGCALTYVNSSVCARP